MAQADPTAAEPPLAIEDHGIVGDLATVALVGREGTIDFLCWPAFDSPSLFAALLDPERGGDFTIRPAMDGARVTQAYLPDTNVLVTRWLAPGGSAEVVDLMPVIDLPGPRLVRRVRATRGRVAFQLRCRPRFDYARTVVAPQPCPGGLRFEPAGLPAVRLVATVPVTVEGNDAVAGFTLEQGQLASFVLDGGDGDPPHAVTIERWLDATVNFWREWAGRSTYQGRWREAVTRSALVLKLLTCRVNHSVLAAATFGLPESPGGARNWDYRAVWIRDASFTVYAFLRLGYRQEAIDFMHWVADRATDAAVDTGGRLQIMYGLDGRRDLPEQTLDHLAGYGGATPVRIGNGAHTQVQLDIHGELLDTVYLVNKYGQAIPHVGWQRMTKTVEYVCQHWREPDAGIWEMRGEPREFLHSRLMCWVAVDRAIRLAHKRSLPAPFPEWSAVRGEIYADIWDGFWNERDGHFTQTRGGDTLDASTLMMPLVRFVSATDPQWLSTLDAIGERLVDDGLVYRYVGDDGLPGQEGAFMPCSFWYAECLARAGRLWEARMTFERALGHANPLGLFAEEVGRSGEFLGNFPQALTHLSLISAAFYLDRQLSGRPPQFWQP